MVDTKQLDLAQLDNNQISTLKDAEKKISLKGEEIYLLAFIKS